MSPVGGRPYYLSKMVSIITLSVAKISRSLKAFDFGSRGQCQSARNSLRPVGCMVERIMSELLNAV